MGSLNSRPKLEKKKFYTPVFGQMKNNYGHKCMLNIEKLIKYHDFPKEGTLSKVRLNVVKESVEKNNEKQNGCCMCVRHVCKGCEQTIGCWLEEAERRER